MSPAHRLELALAGGIRWALLGSVICSLVGYAVYSLTTVVECDTPVTGYGVCIVVHPAWPVLVSLYPLGLVGLVIARRLVGQLDNNGDSWEPSNGI